MILLRHTMTTNSDFYFPSPSSSSSSSLPLKLRKKRSKFINIPNPKHYLKNPDLPISQSHCHSCPECFKLFASQKALYGHMRCHPDRDYRGMIRNPKFPISSSSSPPLIRHQSTSATATLMSVEDHEVAACLLLLSRTETDFESSSCEKVFGSHQAVGGQRATHRNVKGCFAINRSCRIEDENYKEEEDMAMANNNYVGHKCSICLRVFPSGQALGGHKRCHWDQKDTNSSSSSPLIINDNVYCGLMDLNQPASAITITGDVDDSFSSYSCANFNLDLRLGL